jgi:DNA uptake protein ComE-like DNA-binding protein
MECQPPGKKSHPNNMLGRFAICATISCLLSVFAACNQTPDQLREKTAEETAAIKRNTKAVAQGVKEGLGNKRSIDLNKGSKDDLTSLPGISAERADRIIAERPYANTRQLVTRRILSEDQYSQIQDRLVVNR